MIATSTRMVTRNSFRRQRNRFRSRSRFFEALESRILLAATWKAGIATGDWNDPSSEVTIIIQIPDVGDWPLLPQQYEISGPHTFTVTGSPYEEYEWYLDGYLQHDSTSYYFNFNMNPGTYELAVVVTDSAGNMRSGRCWITVR